MISRKMLIILVGLMFLPVAALAQHCPYDGGHMIVVKLTDADDKPIPFASERLSLQEVDNPIAQSCEFSKGLLVRTFLSPLDAFLQRYERQGESAFRRYCADCKFTGDGYYALVLNQAERSCMVQKPDSSDYERYVPRKYEVRYLDATVEQKVAVSPDRIYSMCTSSGKWSRIEPIILRLKPSKSS